MERWLTVVLLAICAVSLMVMVGRGCAEDRRREEARMQAIYRDLGDGDVELGRAYYEGLERMRERGESR